MESWLKFSVAILAILLIFGCAQSPNQKMYVCTSGDVVSNPGLCPGGSDEAKPQETASMPSAPSKPATYCGDGTCQSTENCKSCERDCYCGDGSMCSPTRGSAGNNGCYAIRCGDGYCDSPNESQDNCCGDCGCPTGANCQNNVCVGLKPELQATFVRDDFLPFRFISTTILFSKNNNLKLGTLTIRNEGNDAANGIHIVIESPQGFFEKKEMDYASLQQGETASFDIALNFSGKILEIVDKTDMQLNIKLSYANSINKEFEQTQTGILTVYGRNSISGTYPQSYAAWVSPKQPVIREFAAKATSGLPAGCSTCGSVEDQYLAAYWLFQSMKSYGIAYVNDISNVGDYVQLPYDTFKNKNGDCEDLGILYASLLEAIGMEAVLVIVPGHVFAGFMDKQGNFVPIETTADDFMSAGNMGKYEYETYSKEGEVELIKVRDAWKEYPAVVMPDELDIPLPNISKQIGACNVSFNLPDFWVASADVTFTNNGTAPGAGCAVVITYQGGQVKDAKYGCATIQPSETKKYTMQPDIDILQGFSCVVK